MTVTVTQLALYAGALLILFITPGPVWLALIARGLSGGFASAFPLALGVSVGDVVWPLVAVLGVSWIVGQVEDFMEILRWVAVAMFLGMGVLLIRHAGQQVEGNSRLTRKGRMAGFLAGVAVILGNPKAVLFYMGVLPGFFDLTRLTWTDIAAICALSVVIPLIGNTALALFVDRARVLLSTPRALRRLNIGSGVLLIVVGLAIALL